MCVCVSVQEIMPLAFFEVSRVEGYKEIWRELQRELLSTCVQELMLTQLFSLDRDEMKEDQYTPNFSFIAFHRKLKTNYAIKRKWPKS